MCQTWTSEEAGPGTETFVTVTKHVLQDLAYTGGDGGGQVSCDLGRLCYSQATWARLGPGAPQGQSQDSTPVILPSSRRLSQGMGSGEAGGQG